MIEDKANELAALGLQLRALRERQKERFLNQSLKDSAASMASSMSGDMTVHAADGRRMRVTGAELATALYETKREKIKQTLLAGGSTVNALLDKHNTRAVQLKFLGASSPRLDAVVRATDPNDRESLLAATRDGAAAFLAWITAPFKLERPSHSVAHKAIEEYDLVPHIYNRDGTDEGVVMDTVRPLHSLLVEHDWAALLGDSRRTGGPDGAVEDWHFPYDDQVFELRISGAAVLAFVTAHAEDVAALSLIMRLPDGTWVNDRVKYILNAQGWAVFSGQEFINAGRADVNKRIAVLVDFVWEQIRACVIMLDAEVAVSEPMRAPYKTNQPTKDRKPLPALSHHVVKLYQRVHRPAPLPEAEHMLRGPGVRLHLRRGHWRHYANHKTWIKWMLVGNPDLGFVDKEYRL